mmetsp:Transcript_33943/g.75268  ORF Transcript_33943/g.75268 Transcript_33943/m.75268 type:complete len:160 (+) Transcript_33943:133-612(+)
MKGTEREAGMSDDAAAARGHHYKVIVDGTEFELREDELLRYPSSLLTSDQLCLGKAETSAQRQVAIQRAPELFPFIQGIYRTGSAIEAAIHLPAECSFDQVLDELHYYKLPVELVSHHTLDEQLRGRRLAAKPASARQVRLARQAHMQALQQGAKTWQQ